MHSKGMYAMLDVVGNHMGGTIGDIGGFYPFNQSSHYHGCGACPANCQIDFNANNQQEVELCRLAGLPDLNQSVPFVSSYLNKWIGAQVAGYGFDGIRVDTVPEVDMPFWRSFQAAAGVYAVGEVFNGGVGYVAPYQGGALPGILSYPLFFTMRNVFAQQQPMTQLQDTLKAYSAFQDVVSPLRGRADRSFPSAPAGPSSSCSPPGQRAAPSPSRTPPQDALGTFLDNHDNPRFLYVRNDQAAYKAALTFMVMTRGIPIVYYGSEQGFDGGPDPGCREPLWTSKYATDTPLYQHIKTVVGVRQSNKLWTLPQVQRYADATFYAFSRGQILVAATNVGSDGAQQKRSITYGAGTTWPTGCVLSNAFFPTTDKITVAAAGFEIFLDSGESKIYLPGPGC